MTVHICSYNARCDECGWWTEVRHVRVTVGDGQPHEELEETFIPDESPCFCGNCGEVLE